MRLLLRLHLGNNVLLERRKSGDHAVGKEGGFHDDVGMTMLGRWNKDRRRIRGRKGEGLYIDFERLIILSSAAISRPE